MSWTARYFSLNSKTAGLAIGETTAAGHEVRSPGQPRASAFRHVAPLERAAIPAETAARLDFQRENCPGRPLWSNSLWCGASPARSIAPAREMSGSQTTTTACMQQSRPVALFAMTRWLACHDVEVGAFSATADHNGKLPACYMAQLAMSLDELFQTSSSPAGNRKIRNSAAQPPGYFCLVLKPPLLKCGKVGRLCNPSRARNGPARPCLAGRSIQRFSAVHGFLLACVPIVVHVALPVT